MLRILALGDVHYLRRAEAESVNAGTGPDHFGAEWVARAIRDACVGGEVDVMVLLGDMVQDGMAAGGEEDMRDVAQVVRESGIPLVVVPGNHDGGPEMVFRVFGGSAGGCEVKGYGFYIFADTYDAGNVCSRSPETVAAFLRWAEGVDGKPVIAVQHAPIFPEVDCSEYPYMPVNVEALRASYERAGVTLSLSGHYHAGGPATRHHEVTYFTCSALGSAPYCYSVITLEGRKVTVDERRLRLPEQSGLVDYHTHSHFGYCAEDVHPAGSLERADALGLDAIVCLEHAGQIYLPPDDFWAGRHVHDPRAIEQARGAETNRMAAFRAAMAAWRSARLMLGLEVECDGEGKLNLLAEDRDGWDVLLGAIHWLPDNLPARTESEFEASFMWVAERLVSQGMQILAHPLRVFRANRRARPAGLYRPLARLLQAHGAAAEMNCHHFLPDAEFFRVCAEEGTKIVLSSDAHRLDEVGDLLSHLQVLKEAGIPLAYVRGKG